MAWDGMLEEFEEHIKQMTIVSKKIDDLSNQIKELVSQYNKISEENSLNEYVFYFKVVDLYTVPYNWNIDNETYIDDITEYVSDNPGWLSSSARC